MSLGINNTERQRAPFTYWVLLHKQLKFKVPTACLPSPSLGKLLLLMQSPPSQGVGKKLCNVDITNDRKQKTNLLNDCRRSPQPVLSKSLRRAPPHSDGQMSEECPSNTGVNRPCARRRRSPRQVKRGRVNKLNAMMSKRRSFLPV